MMGTFSRYGSETGQAASAIDVIPEARSRSPLTALKMTTIEVGSTNVYAELGYPDAAEMQRKATLAAEIAQSIRILGMTLGDAAEQLDVGQDEISKITRGRFRGLSEALLLDLAEKLGGGGNARSLAPAVQADLAAAREWRKDHPPKSTDLTELMRGI
jgi:predicted XRE-type DNA-binding protein